MSPDIFGRSVNPTPTRGGRLFRCVSNAFRDVATALTALSHLVPQSAEARAEKKITVSAGYFAVLQI